MTISFQPHKGDGPRTQTVLNEVRLGRLKGDLARKLVQQARIDDAKEADSARKGGAK